MQGTKVAGRYLLQQKLGAGGFGETWLAADLDDRASKVVVKLARQTVTDAAVQRELEALRHVRGLPGVANMLEHGVDNEHRYVVYRYVEGRSLAAFLSVRGRPSLVRSLAIAHAIAKALAGLHARGIIHRDLKPSNIVVPDDTAMHGEIVLVDFGIAGQLKVETGHTQSGEIFGTPEYMSPEQLAGRPQTPAADVYGFGAVLFEMLYGQPLFTGTSWSELAIQKYTFDAKLPFEPSLPGWLSDLLVRCLGPDPDTRPKDGQALVALLDMGAARKPVQQPQSSDDFGPFRAEARDMVRPRVRRSVLPWLSLTLVMVVGALSVSYTLSFRSRPSLTPSASVPPTESAQNRPSQPAAERTHEPASETLSSNVALLLVVLGPIVLLSSVGVSWQIHRSLRLRSQREEVGLGVLAGRAKGRGEVSRSIAIEIEQVIACCREADQRIIGHSIALLISEYESATASDDRQKALMHAMGLLDKLTVSMSPWYVRNDKLVPTAVAIVGAISGVATTVFGLLGK